MIPLTHEHLTKEFCRETKKWAISIKYNASSYPVDKRYHWTPVKESIPFLDKDMCFSLVTTGHLDLIFENETEAREKLSQIYTTHSPQVPGLIPYYPLLINNLGFYLETK